ncbi:MAG TPA: hypothetical protein VEA59_02535 [Patescibacteria group bacterium]|nr:hypothetical protein [Patescibacteria group bacterium]
MAIKPSRNKEPLFVQIPQRQAKILAAVVKENCETGEPVGSKEILEKYHFECSAATIRNEMQDLEQQGYISQPHTSAGRVPTDKGFRYFVNQLMEKTKLSMQEQERLRTEVLKLQGINAEIGRRLAKLLAESTHAASFTLLPDETSAVGLSNIMSAAGLPQEDVKEISKFFDNLDEHAEGLIQKYQNSTAQAYIGKELQLTPKSDYSVIVTGVQLPDGKKGVVGLIGPKSMKYEKNLPFMEYISKLLGIGGSIFLITIIK